MVCSHWTILRTIPKLTTIIMGSTVICRALHTARRPCHWCHWLLLVISSVSLYRSQCRSVWTHHNCQCQFYSREYRVVETLSISVALRRRHIRTRYSSVLFDRIFSSCHIHFISDYLNLFDKKYILFLKQWKVLTRSGALSRYSCSSRYPTLTPPSTWT